MSVEHRWNDNDKENTELPGENLSQCHVFDIKNPHGLTWE